MNFDHRMKRNLNGLSVVQQEEVPTHSEPLHRPMATSSYYPIVLDEPYSRIKDTPSAQASRVLSSVDKQKDANEEELPVICTKGGVKVPFPVKLMDLLNIIDTKEPQLASVISWQPSGESFKVRDKKRFEMEVQRNFFTQTNYTSFRRQLNLWGFKRIEEKKSEDCGAYFHPQFKRSDKYGCRLMRRCKSRSTNSNSLQASTESKGKMKKPTAKRVSISYKKKNTTHPPSPCPDLVTTMMKDKKFIDLNEKKARRVSVSNEKNIISFWSDEIQDISSSTRTHLDENLANMDTLDSIQEISTNLSFSSPSWSNAIETCHCPRSSQDELEPIVDEKECTLPHDVVVLFLVHAMQESDYFQTSEPTSSCLSTV